ncbi:PF07588 family protein [Leptospira weilii str. Ecochallenge]|uniref:PF07588 family protein n=1 Tax=Leptospira weilii str. Ecochallenge TaxID=1049986 RepID=N1U382_9LEPT|nr:PF07588 family protein [Leptospira weilii str. Ecochallenge]
MFQKMFLTLLTGSVVLTLYSCEDKKEDNMGTLFFLLSASGGLGSSQTPASTSCKNEAFCRTFIATNNGAGYNGNLGGISGADAKCAAAKPSTLTRTYKALLTDQQNRHVVNGVGLSFLKDWVLYPNKQYRRSDGTTVTFTTNADSMVTGNLENGIDSGAKKYFWTGFAHPDDPGFFLWEGGRTCNRWEDANGAVNAAAGNTTSVNAHQTTEGAFTLDNHNCNSNLNLLCVEQ